MPHVVAVPREKWCPLGVVRLHWVMLRREITGMSMPRRTVGFPAGHPGRRVEWSAGARRPPKATPA